MTLVNEEALADFLERATPEEARRAAAALEAMAAAARLAAVELEAHRPAPVAFTGSPVEATPRRGGS